MYVGYFNMSAGRRTTNNSVASLDEQSLLLNNLFQDKKEKSKEKLSKKSKKIKRKSAESVSKKSATISVNPNMADLAGNDDASQQKSIQQLALEENDMEEQIDPQLCQLPQNLQRFGNFVPGFRFGQIDMPNWDDEQEQDGDQLVHGNEHSISEDDEADLESYAESEEVVQDKPPIIQEKVIPEITSKGLGADLLKQHLTKVKESDRVAPKVKPPVALGIDKFLKESWFVSEMEKVAKLYPRVENIDSLKVPKLDSEVYQVVDQSVRNMDQSLQTVQKSVIASISALAPLLDLAIARGDTDEELDPLTQNLIHSMQMLSFTVNGLSARRKDILKPYLDPAYARVLTKGHDTTSEWLYGGDLLATTKRCDAAKKIAEKVLKRKHQDQPKQRMPNNPKRFKGPQQGTQGMLRGFNPYSQNPRFPAPQNFGYGQVLQYPNQGFNQQGFYQKAFRPRQPFQQQNQQNMQGKKLNTFPK